MYGNRLYKIICFPLRIIFVECKPTTWPQSEYFNLGSSWRELIDNSNWGYRTCHGDKYKNIHNFTVQNTINILQKQYYSSSLHKKIILHSKSSVYLSILLRKI